MPKAQTHKKSGGMRKIGRAARKPKTARYKNNMQHEKNKLKRILQSNGTNAATLYAKENNIENYLRKLVL